MNIDIHRHVGKDTALEPDPVDTFQILRFGRPAKCQTVGACQPSEGVSNTTLATAWGQYWRVMSGLQTGPRQRPTNFFVNVRNTHIHACVWPWLECQICCDSSCWMSFGTFQERPTLSIQDGPNVSASFTSRAPVLYCHMNIRNRLQSPQGM